MTAPKPGPDGVRRYGRPYSPVAEDPTRCVMSVMDHKTGMRFPASRQCKRARGHGEGGLFCKLHDPAAVEAKRQATLQRRNSRADREARERRRPDAYRAALQAIADGHNDPRGLARETLDEWK